jgi:hypothetical protein
MDPFEPFGVVTEVVRTVQATHNGVVFRIDIVRTLKPAAKQLEARYYKPDGSPIPTKAVAVGATVKGAIPIALSHLATLLARTRPVKKDVSNLVI